MINIYWLKCCQNVGRFHLGLRVFIYYYYFIFLCAHSGKGGGSLQHFLNNPIVYSTRL
jgi:hypothetical protein